MVESLPQNEDAQRIFGIVRYQLVMSMNGPVDLMQTAIHETMRLYKVKNKRSCFEKVLALGQWWIKKLKEGSDEG
jgi:hypothetical protein